MSTWKPSEGLSKSELLVQILEIEARAAGSVITPVFRHRMVEMIANVIDNSLPVSAAQTARAETHTWENRKAVLKTTSNGHHPEDHIDDEAVHAEPDEIMPEKKPAKAAKSGKTGKKTGKRGRPSKAELAARTAQA